MGGRISKWIKQLQLKKLKKNGGVKTPFKNRNYENIIKVQAEFKNTRK